MGGGSVGGGVAWLGACMVGVDGREACMAGGMHGKEACMAGGIHGIGCVTGAACVAGGLVLPGGVHNRGHVWRGVACMAGEMATAVSGMHPTGMHSCCH